MTNLQGAQPWQCHVAPVTRSTADARLTYDRLARWYDRVEAPFERRARNLGLSMLAAAPDESILEIGFGTGQTLEHLARRAGHLRRLVGLDLSSGMIRIARNRLRAAQLVTIPALLQGDAQLLPFADGCFDAVTMSFTLELMQTANIPIVLGECRRVLRTEGRAVVVSLALREPINLPVRLYLGAHRRWPRVVDCRPIPLEEILAANDFRVTHARTVGIFGLPVVVAVALP